MTAQPNSKGEVYPRLEAVESYGRSARAHAHSALLPAALERINQQHRALAVRRKMGSEIYDLLGSLSVFGFLTVYALVALALPFARKARGQHSTLVAIVSGLTVAVMILIAVFDLRFSSDPVHARISYLYLLYIAADLAWYGISRKKTAARAE